MLTPDYGRVKPKEVEDRGWKIEDRGPQYSIVDLQRS